MSNMVLKKTFNFSVNSIEVYRTLIAKSEYVLSKQFLRASTSIGANVREAQRAQSKKDFLSKINIALKEADETLYWIELLYATNYLDKREFDFLDSNCIELVKILSNIVATTKIIYYYPKFIIHHS